MLKKSFYETPWQKQAGEDCFTPRLTTKEFLNNMLSEQLNYSASATWLNKVQQGVKTA